MIILFELEEISYFTPFKNIHPTSGEKESSLYFNRSVSLTAEGI